MCGIAGFEGVGTEKSLREMVQAVRHRGPDYKGIFLRGRLGFAHARLSILDLSPGARQPMMLPDESVAIVFNGEIYNYSELRAELEKRGRTFRTSSDTEVILHLYALHGDACFKRLIGMFAIALYDFKARKLLLARDRMGEKPLYWSYTNETLVFASEIKALFASGLIPKELDLHALDQYLQFDYVPTPHSIIRGVNKLEPATILTCKGGAITKKQFWHPPRAIENVSEKNALLRLEEGMRNVVRRELVADVPVGVFLSGGIDSSAIAYYAQRESKRPIETFSIAFEDKSFDESSHARLVAGHLGTVHHERTVTSNDALAIVPRLADVLDEPLADASIIPTLLLSKFAREHVTVALGGEGGDELFAGYPTFRADKLFDLYRRFPRVLRRAVSKAADMLPVSHANFAFSHNLRKFVSSDSPDAARRHIEWLGTFNDTARRALARSSMNGDVFAEAQSYAAEYKPNDLGNRILWTYARTYLMDQVLVKVDRASMRYALEVRAPFLDHTNVDFVFALPYSFKYRNGTTKYLLKKLMKGKLPSSIINRKKKGFGVPMAKWLTGPLKPLCTDLLSADRIKKQGLFDHGYITRLVNDHMMLRRDNRKELWNLMVFQLWFDRWMR